MRNVYFSSIQNHYLGFQNQHICQDVGLHGPKPKCVYKVKQRGCWAGVARGGCVRLHDGVNSGGLCGRKAVWADSSGWAAG